MYINESVDGMDAGNFTSAYDTSLYGITLGVDKTFNTETGKKYRAGLAFNVGGGSAESTGTASGMENDFTFYGVNLYGGMGFGTLGIGELSVSANLGYTATTNEVKYNLSKYNTTGTPIDNLKADVDSSVISFGAQAEYLIKTDIIGGLNIIPHVGLNVISMTTDAYDTKTSTNKADTEYGEHGNTVFKTKEETQTFATIPVKAKFSKDIETASGWSIKPKAETGLTFAAGNTDANSTSTMPGVEGVASINTQVLDTTTFTFGVGTEVKKENLSFGVDYDLQLSGNRTAHGIKGTFEYKF